MPLIMTSGDTLLTKAQTIAHGVAPGENYPTGFALALRNRFPDCADDFKRACRAKNLEPGQLHLWRGPEKWILNLLTQDAAYSRDVRTTRAHGKYLRKALRELARASEKMEITSIAMPRICAGLGKMKWIEVKSILEDEPADVSIPVFVYERFQQGETSLDELKVFPNPRSKSNKF